MFITTGRETIITMFTKYLPARYDLVLALSSNSYIIILVVYITVTNIRNIYTHELSFSNVYTKVYW